MGLTVTHTQGGERALPQESLSTRIAERLGLDSGRAQARLTGGRLGVGGAMRVLIPAAMLKLNADAVQAGIGHQAGARVRDQDRSSRQHTAKLRGVEWPPRSV
jgi:hypothetical protein